jgi:hypothetical protein
MATGSTGQPSPIKTPSPHKLPPLSPKIEPIPIKVPPTDIHVPPPSPKTKPAPADKPPPPVTTPTADSSQPAWMDMLQEQEQAEKAVPAYISTGGGSAWITNAMNPPQESPPTPALETIEQNNLKATRLEYVRIDWQLCVSRAISQKLLRRMVSIRQGGQKYGCDRDGT